MWFQKKACPSLGLLGVHSTPTYLCGTCGYVKEKSIRETPSEEAGLTSEGGTNCIVARDCMRAVIRAAIIACEAICRWYQIRL